MDDRFCRPREKVQKYIEIRSCSGRLFYFLWYRSFCRPASSIIVDFKEFDPSLREEHSGFRLISLFLFIKFVLKCIWVCESFIYACFIGMIGTFLDCWLKRWFVFLYIITSITLINIKFTFYSFLRTVYLRSGCF